MTRKKIDMFGLVLTSACLLWAIILCIVDFDWWTFAGTLFVAGLIVLTWILIRRSKPVDHSTHDGHTVGICDNCVPICYDGGAPLDFVDWYGKRYFCDRERASEIVSRMSSSLRAQYTMQYDDYLSHKKFKNYPRP